MGGLARQAHFLAGKARCGCYLIPESFRLSRSSGTRIGSNGRSQAGRMVAAFLITAAPAFRSDRPCLPRRLCSDTRPVDAIDPGSTGRAPVPSRERAVPKPQRNRSGGTVSQNGAPGGPC